MACAYRFPNFLHFFLVFTIISCCTSSLVSANHDLDEDNWRQILEGEWMVEFYAPWCPACHALAPAWKELSSRAGRKNLEMKAAAVDVTKAPGLSGRFVVTALPTIFHVKDAEFRQYKGPRDVDSMLGFVENERWRSVDPVPGWKAPDSIQMTLVAEFFKLSQVLRTVHTTLMEQYGLPTWGSYLIFAIATIFIGALLGLVLVCIIDLLYPPRRHKHLVSEAEVRAAREARGARGADDEQQLINDDIVDDKEDSDAEKNSAPDTSEEEGDKKTSAPSSEPEGAGDAGGAGAGAGGGEARQVRRRRARKAD